MSNGELGMSEPLGAQPNIVTFDIDGVKTFVEGPNKRTQGPLPTNTEYFGAVEQLGFLIHRFQETGKTIDGIGISIPATIEDGRLVDTRKLRRRDWYDAPLVEDLAQETGISADRIVLLNDREAGAIAEQAARPEVELGFFVNIGRSFSGGPYSKKNLREDPIAPQIAPDAPGHHFLRLGATCPCGKHGCIEAFVSNYALRQTTKKWADELPPDDRIWEHFKIDLADAMTDTVKRYQGTFGQPVETVSIFGTIALKGPDVFGSLHGNLLPKLGKDTPEIVFAKHGVKSALVGIRLATRRFLAQ